MFGLKCLLNYSGIRGSSNRHLIRNGDYSSNMVLDRVLPKVRMFAQAQACSTCFPLLLRHNKQMTKEVGKLIPSRIVLASRALRAHKENGKQFIIFPACPACGIHFSGSGFYRPLRTTNRAKKWALAVLFCLTSLHDVPSFVCAIDHADVHRKLYTHCRYATVAKCIRRVPFGTRGFGTRGVRVCSHIMTVYVRRFQVRAYGAGWFICRPKTQPFVMRTKKRIIVIVALWQRKCFLSFVFLLDF